jgi:hypothetical protein
VRIAECAYVYLLRDPPSAHSTHTPTHTPILCVLISFIHNLGLTIKPMKGPPQQGVYACPHNGLPPATSWPNPRCVCVFSCSIPIYDGRVA